MPRFSTVLFDLDGTLIDHFAAIHRSHSHTLGRLGLPLPTLAQVRAAVGGGLENAIAKLAGRDRVAEALPIYRAYWDATMLDDVVLLPGAIEILRALRARGLKTAVFTNKLGSSSRLICTHLGLAPFLDGNFGAADTPWLKPQPEFAAHALAQLGATAATTLLVGDSPFDIAAAHNAGFPCWAVTTGTHSAAELREAKADAVFENLTDVQVALET
ncbi:MAG: HAD family hydrolase [Verrucomicrobia bacterium]|nr:HAD family hydrolase [Verrucomicrobiota bacterium]